MRLSFDCFRNFAKLDFKICADIFNCERIRKSTNENLCLGIPFFDINLLLANSKLSLVAEALDVLRRDHEESLELSFFFF